MATYDGFNNVLFDLHWSPGISEPPVVHTSQYENGSKLRIRLIDGNGTFAWYNGNNGIVKLQGTKPDRTGFSIEGTVESKSDQDKIGLSEDEQYNFSFWILEQMTAVSGDVRCEVVYEIFATTGEVAKRQSSQNFILRVEPAGLADDTIISETELPLIRQAETNATNAKNYATIAQTSAESAEESATSASASASSASTSASNAKTSETNAKTSETNAKTSETNASSSASSASTSATNAKTSETNAKNSASSASASATSASASATSASESATSAQEYAEALENAITSGTMTVTYSGGITGTKTVPYVDFADGTRIVWQPNFNTTTKSAMVTYVSPIYQIGVTIAFSNIFTSACFATFNGSVPNGAGWGVVLATTADSISVRLVDASQRASGSSVNVSWVAIGKWK